MVSYKLIPLCSIVRCEFNINNQNVWKCNDSVRVAKAMFHFQFQFGGFNMFPDISRPFNNSYKCYSVSMFPGNDRQDVEKGGKSECYA